MIGNTGLEIEKERYRGLAVYRETKSEIEQGLWVQRETKIRVLDSDVYQGLCVQSQREREWGFGIQRETGGQGFIQIDILGVKYLEKMRYQEMGFQRERERLELDGLERGSLHIRCLE